MREQQALHSRGSLRMHAEVSLVELLYVEVRRTLCVKPKFLAACLR